MGWIKPVLILLCLQGSVGTDPVPVRRSRTASLILHDWYGEGPVPTPAYLREHQGFLKNIPFDGIALYLRSADDSVNVSTAILSGTVLDPSLMTSVLAPLEGLDLGNLTENFAAVVGGTPPDFFDDGSAVVANFAHLARAARVAGLRGIYFDNEGYDVPWSVYPVGVRYPTKSLHAYQERARVRGREIMEAMVREFPDITVILLHGPYVSEGKVPVPLFPRWRSERNLLGPFFSGFVEGAGDRARVVDGGELYHLRTAEEFQRSYRWRRSHLVSDTVDCRFIPPLTRKCWDERVSLAFGVIDQPFAQRAMNPEILQGTLSRALRCSDDYVWLYVEGPTFLAPASEGGAPEEWWEAVRGARSELATERDGFRCDEGACCAE